LSRCTRLAPTPRNAELLERSEPFRLLVLVHARAVRLRLQVAPQAAPQLLAPQAAPLLLVLLAQAALLLLDRQVAPRLLHHLGHLVVPLHMGHHHLVARLHLEAHHHLVARLHLEGHHHLVVPLHMGHHHLVARLHLEGHHHLVALLHLALRRHQEDHARRHLVAVVHHHPEHLGHRHRPEDPGPHLHHSRKLLHCSFDKVGQMTLDRFNAAYAHVPKSLRIFFRKAPS